MPRRRPRRRLRRSLRELRRRQNRARQSLRNSKCPRTKQNPSPTKKKKVKKKIAMFLMARKSVST
jgi:hypothetical protein